MGHEDAPEGKPQNEETDVATGKFSTSHRRSSSVLGWR
jgi:hypothetical protein